ncbi:hypothetical protein GV64_16570 [Endozoicomonas elysicola]|uniref:Uncharacterized protein n=1 Tax=Endozoicomonas elysicola TaxID=305900 RepID=A0A081KDA0_9GAMM|nr:hypothetical protein GV64_16570 [Endozoicomonas elysicola]
MLIHSAALAIIDRHRVGLGHHLVSGQVINIRIGHIEGPVHLAGAIPRCIVADGRGKGAEVPAGVGGDADGLHIGEIDIGDGEAAGVGQGGGVLASTAVDNFSDCAGDVGGGGNGRDIVGAGDGHRDLLIHGAALTIVHGDGVGLGDHLVFGQVINVGIGHAEGPVHLASAIAGGVVADRWGEGAQVIVGVGSDADGLHIGQIDVSDGEAASIGQGSGIFTVTAVDNFSDRGNDIGGRGNGGHVVGAGDGHGDLLIHGTAVAIVHRHGVGLGDHLIPGQVINVGIGYAEGPVHLAGAVPRRIVADHRGKGAQVPAGVGSDTDGLYIGEIDIGDGEAAGVGQGGGVLASTAVDNFSDRASDIGGRGNGGHVVGAGDGHGHPLIHCAALAIVDRHRVGLGHHLVLSQIINIGIGHAEGPFHLAGAIVSGVVADRRGKDAQVTVGVGGDTDGLHIGQVDVGDGEAAAVG